MSMKEDLAVQEWHRRNGTLGAFMKGEPCPEAPHPWDAAAPHPLGLTEDQEKDRGA